MFYTIQRMGAGVYFSNRTQAMKLADLVLSQTLLEECAFYQHCFSRAYLSVSDISLVFQGRGAGMAGATFLAHSIFI